VRELDDSRAQAWAKRQLGREVRRAAGDGSARPVGLLFGVLAPIMCLATDPLFFTSSPPDNLVFGGHGAGSLLMWLAYGSVAVSMVGMVVFATCNGDRARLAAAPALVLGVLVSGVFSVAILPIAFFSLFTVVLIPLGWSPMLCGASYLWALVRCLAGRDRRTTAIVGLLGLGLFAIPAGIGLHYEAKVAALGRARAAHEVARACDGLVRYGRLARHDLRRVYLAADPLRRRWMRGLWVEAGGEPLYDLIADEQRGSGR